MKKLTDWMCNTGFKIIVLLALAEIAVGMFYMIKFAKECGL